MLGLAAIATGLLATGHPMQAHGLEPIAQCTSSDNCTPAVPAPSLFHLASEFALRAATGNSRTEHGTALSAKEFSSYDGVGAIVCKINGKRRTATAFLVGRFDIAVTVAHTFVGSGPPATPSDCTYISAGPNGGIRERIPLASIKMQWTSQPDTFGQPASDIAVVRLSRTAQFARRTLPLGRLAPTNMPVAMIAFESDFAADTIKRKLLGTAYQQRRPACVPFTHSIDAHGASAGAPLIDVRDGMVIGIHTRLRAADPSSHCRNGENVMITVSDWLERTLRAEIASNAQTAHD
jgi:hypothetical protein